MMSKKIVIILSSISLFIVVLISSFFIYVNIYYKAEVECFEILKEREDIEINGDITYIPSTTASDIGFIFYPGAKVEAISYLPLLELISQNGINVYLVEMPFNLAFFGSNKADDVMDQYDNEYWYIGGHSLGGAFASNYASKNKNKINGLILLGAYIYGDYNIDDSVTIYGEFDHIMSKLEYETNVYMIDGGNHAYFGNYGEQKKDGVANISKRVQQEQTTNILVDFVKNNLLNC